MEEDTGLSDLLRAVARTPSVAPFAGTERYRLVRCLGEGGFGVVYEVDDRELGRRVALKTLKPTNAGSAENVRRLKGEFRAVADIVHPNLVGLHELSTDGTRWFFTMDLIAGTNFLDYVRGDETRLRAALAQLLAGVRKLHEVGIVHRDLKPSNVLVEDGRVVILDFGLANLDDDDPSIAGTPDYMAPELLTGARATPAVDWYAVGIMLKHALPHHMPVDLRELCDALLAADPAARPSGEAIARMLGHATADVPATREQPFVGRAAELAIMRAAYVERGTRIVRIAGEPGVGKSALLARFLDEVDGVVFAARCHEREAVPFKAFDGVADALVRYFRGLPRNEAAGLLPRDIHLVTQLFPALESIAAIADVPRRDLTGDPRELRARAFIAFKELLARIADKQPLVIAIDDLQWGDLDSAKLLAQLVAPPAAPAMLLVLCYRVDDVATSAPLADTLRALGASSTEIALRALATDDATRLAADLLGEAGERARVIAKRGEGHPLFIAELARAELHGDRAAPTLMDALWERVVRLSQHARELLETVAIAGQPMPATLCFEAAGVGASGVDALRTLRAEQLARGSDSGSINVFHDRIRDTVLVHADASARRTRHLALAQSLERRGSSDLEALAYHFDAADERAQAGRYALAAGDAAMRALAFDRAATLYRLAIERDPAARVHEKLADALLHAGSTAAAGEAYLAAAARTDASNATTLTGLAGEYLLSGGDYVAGLHALDEALGRVGETRPQSLGMSTVEGLRHLILMRLGKFQFRETEEATIPADQLLRLDILRAATWGCAYVSIAHAFGIGMRYSRLALRIGEPRRAGWGMLWAALGLMARQTSLPPAINELFDRVEGIASRYSDDKLQAMSLRMRAQVNMMFGNFVIAREICDAAAAMIAEKCQGMSQHRRFVLAFAACCDIKLGELARAKQLSDELFADAVDRGDPVHERLACLVGLGPLHLAANDPDKAQSFIGRSHAEDRCGTLILGGEAVAAHAMYVDRPRDAVAAWRERWPRLKQYGVLMQPLFHVGAMHSLATALLASGGSHREAARLAKSIRRHRFAYGAAISRCLEGCLAVRARKDARAIALLRAAAELHDSSGAILEAAACRHRASELAGDAETAAVAQQLIRSHGVVDPDRWMTTVVPRLADLRG